MDCFPKLVWPGWHADIRWIAAPSPGLSVSDLSSLLQGQPAAELWRIGMWAWVGCLAGRLSGERGMGAEAPAEVRGRYMCVCVLKGEDRFQGFYKEGTWLGCEQVCKCPVFVLCVLFYFCVCKERKAVRNTSNTISMLLWWSLHSVCLATCS